MDYWCTSYREAALWLNDNAPANSIIGADGPIELLYPYLRSDLIPELASQPGRQYDYLVITSRYNQDLNLYPEANIIYSIERKGAILAVIKQPSP
jgi:hypothetical protein